MYVSKEAKKYISRTHDLETRLTCTVQASFFNRGGKLQIPRKTPWSRVEHQMNTNIAHVFIYLFIWTGFAQRYKVKYSKRYSNPDFDHNIGNTMPYSLQIHVVCGFFNIPQINFCKQGL